MFPLLAFGVRLHSRDTDEPDVRAPSYLCTDRHPLILKLFWIVYQSAVLSCSIVFVLPTFVTNSTTTRSFDIRYILQEQLMHFILGSAYRNVTFCSVM